MLSGSLLAAFLRKKPKQGFGQSNPVLGLAFPHNQHAPAGILQFGTCCRIARNVLIQLCVPELRIRRRALAAWTVVPMPEAAVHEDYLPMSGKNNIGVTRQITPVQPKPVPGRMKYFTNCDLRRRVSISDFRHHPASLCGGDPVSHFRPALSVTNSSIAAAILRASNGGTALPICRATLIFLPLNTKSSGND